VSTSIRPPTGSTGGIDSTGGVDAAQEVAPSDELSGAGEVARSQAAGAAQGTAGAQHPSQVWLSRLSAGEITRAQAIDGLVAQALEAHGGAALTSAKRAELEGILRTALLEDPVLGRLLGGG
jgi:hypothetical protein